MLYGVAQAGLAEPANTTVPPVPRSTGLAAASFGGLALAGESRVSLLEKGVY
jgi:hypothetical protein